MSEVRRRKKGLEGFGFSIPEALKEAKDQMDRALEPVPSPSPDVIVSIVPAIKSDTSPAISPDKTGTTLSDALPKTSPGAVPDGSPGATPDHLRSLKPITISQEARSEALATDYSPGATPGVVPGAVPDGSPGAAPDYPALHPTTQAPVITEKSTSEQAPEATLLHPALHPTVHPAQYPASHPTPHPALSPALYPTVHPASHPTQYPALHPTKGSILKDPVWGLTETQARILMFLIKEESRVTRRKDIQNALQISENTIKSVIKVLTKEKFIISIQKYSNRRFQGFSYLVNEALCSEFIEKRVSEQTMVHPALHPASYPALHPALYPALHTPGATPDGSPGATPNLFSSSSFLIQKATTTKGDDSPGAASDVMTEEQAFEQFLQTDSELGYWREKGLTVKQIQQWMKLSNTSAADIFQSLCHCRFEMVDLDLETSKPVENVFNWFYRMIERVGYYPAPKGYKSFRQRQVERERALLEERAKEIRDLQEIRQKKNEQELELAFQEMMNDQEGELFKAILDRLPPIAKELSRGKLFESAMKLAFEEYLQEKEREMLAKATCQQLQ